MQHQQETDEELRTRANKLCGGGMIDEINQKLSEKVVEINNEKTKDEARRILQPSGLLELKYIPKGYTEIAVKTYYSQRGLTYEGDFDELVKEVKNLLTVIFK